MARLSDLLAPREGSSRSASLDLLFEEEPVPLQVFIEDPKFLGNPPLSPEQFSAVQAIERIYLPATFELIAEAGPGTWEPSTVDYWTRPARMVNDITLMWGKGSGKDHICRMASLRVCYLLLCLNEPQRYYNLPQQDTIHTLNVASTKDQARLAFFTPLTRAVARGWFKDRCSPTRNEIEWDKHVTSISGSSEAETQEGLNLMLGIADEVDAFRSAAELERYQGTSPRESGHAVETILNMLHTSASTRFPVTYKNVRISYSRFMGSQITKLVDEARKDIEERGEENSSHYVSGPLATWDVNPNLFDVPREIPYKDGRAMNDRPVPVVYLKDYQKDPVKARTMYECRPSQAIAAYFSNQQAVQACIRKDRPQPISFDYELLRIGNGEPVWQPNYVFHPDFRPIAGAVYALHADLAQKHDRAGIAMAHVVKMEEFEALADVDGEGGQETITEMRPHVKVDFVMGFEASASEVPAREIQLRWARQLAFKLRQRGFQIGLFSYDGWQSLDSLQILAARGIESKLVSMDKSDAGWKNLRDLMYEGRWETPVSALLEAELLSLNRHPNGKVDHPVGGSKDLADAAAGASLGAVELGGSEADDGEVIYGGADTFDVGSEFELPSGYSAVGPVDTSWQEAAMWGYTLGGAA